MAKVVLLAGFAVLFSLPSANAYDMSATFKALKTCSECTAAGYGWCPLRRMCGGFANKECGIGPNYVADSAKPTKASPPPKAKPKAKRSPPQPAGGGGNDMSSVFAKLRDCASCTAAGYGWCPNLRKCGGFANKQCGIGERYVSADPPPRNGLWESKKSKEAAAKAEAGPTADVPAAPSPPPATLLYAGPASPPPPSAKGTKRASAAAAVEITANGAATTFASTSSSHAASNGTGLLGEAELRELPRDVLVRRVLDLQNVVESLI